MGSLALTPSKGTASSLWPTWMPTSSPRTTSSRSALWKTSSSTSTELAQQGCHATTMLVCFKCEHIIIGNCSFQALLSSRSIDPIHPRTHAYNISHCGLQQLSVHPARGTRSRKRINTLKKHQK